MSQRQDTVEIENRTEIHRLVCYIRNDLEPFIKELEHKIKCLETGLERVKKNKKFPKINLDELDVSSDEEDIPEYSKITEKMKNLQNIQKNKKRRNQ